MKILTENEVCERALRKIGATAIRSTGPREAEMTEAAYWHDMVIGHLAARKRTWWLVPNTVTRVLRPFTWNYELGQFLLPNGGVNGVQAVIDVWIGSAGGVGVDAYPNTPGWRPPRDDMDVGPDVELNGLVRLGKVRRQEWEGVQVVDLPFPLGGNVVPPTTQPWWPPPPGTQWWLDYWPESCGVRPPWCLPDACWPWSEPPADWCPPWDCQPPFWCFLPAGGRTQYGKPNFVYIDRGPKPSISFSPAPDAGGPYTVRILFQTYSPDFVSGQGYTSQSQMRETWNLYRVTALAAQIGNGPVRKLPADEVNDMKKEAASLLTDLENWDDDEQAGSGRVTFFNGI